MTMALIVILRYYARYCREACAENIMSRYGNGTQYVGRGRNGVAIMANDNEMTVQ
jgi:hypothetical protein